MNRYIFLRLFGWLLLVAGGICAYLSQTGFHHWENQLWDAMVICGAVGIVVLGITIQRKHQSWARTSLQLLPTAGLAVIVYIVAMFAAGLSGL